MKTEEIFYNTDIPIDNFPDMIYFYSNPLVDRKFDIELQKDVIYSTNFASLSIDAEYNRII